MCEQAVPSPMSFTTFLLAHTCGSHDRILEKGKFPRLAYRWLAWYAQQAEKRQWPHDITMKGAAERQQERDIFYGFREGTKSSTLYGKKSGSGLHTNC